ncbi:hypothetical protein PGT21_032464 [Puccinia graminis f. sp. tritici]|uniref:Uncharacterized protein n=1 Tax=Puccinia graminis f. sp. tritici TaxID=56615 RepID=A0A5B0PCC4_PUCGR|nr:hypothetical protein PGT21_032464 [Puccinia graminis f. sp. tritici]
MFGDQGRIAKQALSGIRSPNLANEAVFAAAEAVFTPADRAAADGRGSFREPSDLAKEALILATGPPCTYEDALPPGIPVVLPIPCVPPELAHVPSVSHCRLSTGVALMNWASV